MKRFRFTLPALKTLRERRETEALEAYAKAVRLQHQAEAELARARQTLEATWLEMQTCLNQGVTAFETIQIQAYSQQVQTHCREKETTLAKARQNVQRQCDLLMVARQKREVVDKFLERQKVRYQLEVRREEQKMLDELAGNKSASALTQNLNVNSTIQS
jgi:flagellar export protein FliJ